MKLLDKHLHAMAESVDEQLIVVSQVSLVAFLIIFLLTFHFIILVPDFAHLELITFVLKMCSRFLWLILILDTRKSLILRSGNMCNIAEIT